MAYYWTKQCKSHEEVCIQMKYQELWKWIYGIYNGTCLHTSLLKWFENASLEQCKKECCSSCDIKQTPDFEGQG